jgi:hypothetical protein
MVAPIHFNYYVLIKLYDRLEKNPNDELKGLTMYHSSVGYAQAAIKAKFNKEYTYDEVVSLMVEEELLNKHGDPVKVEDLVVNLERTAP